MTVAREDGVVEGLSISASGLLTGRILAPIAVDSQTLRLHADGVYLATLQARMPLGATADGRQHWLGFDYSLEPAALTDWAVIELRGLEETVLARLSLEARDPLQFETAEALRHWLFHHRTLSASDYAGCQAIFDQWQDAELQASRACTSEALVSILMPVFQPGKELFAAIDSVLKQSDPRWELILIDDGSLSFPTLGPILKDQRVRYFRVAENLGQSAVRNLALTLATGRFVAFLDSDCRWHPDFITVMRAALVREPQRDFVFCGQAVWELSGALWGVRAGDYHPSLLSNENYIDLNCLMVRRETLEAVGGFDAALGALEDWDLVRRLSQTTDPKWVKANLSDYNARRPLSVSQSIRPSLYWPSIVAKFQGEVLRQEIADQTFTFDFGLESPKKARGVTIIIPSFNVPEILSLCIEHLFRTIDPTQIEVIIIDNGSDAETQSMLDTLSATYPTLRLYRSETNGGFTCAVNQGIARARPEDDIVLLNNDAIVTNGWLEALQNAAGLCDVGLVVPQQILPPGTHTIGHHAPAANPNHEIDVNLSFHHKNVCLTDAPLPSGRFDLTFAPFFCVYIRRVLLEAIGPLSEASGRHYNSDTDYCARTLQAGWRLIYTPEARVYHLLQRSTLDLSRRVPGNFGKIFT